MTEEKDVHYYYQRDGKELITVSLQVAIMRRDPGTTIYIDNGSGKKPIDIQ